MENTPSDSTEIEVVLVPAKGEFLVRDGKVAQAVEVSLFDLDSEYMNWTVWTWREDEDS